MTLPTGVRRHLPQGGMTRTTFVPLLSPPDGDEFEAFIRVPMRLVKAKPFSNERHEFNKLVNAELKKWTEWRAKHGWILASKPKVRGPYNPPSPLTGAEPVDAEYGEHRRYYVTARFKRDTPKWMPLDGMLWVHEQAERYGIDLSKPIRDTGEDKGKDVIVDRTPTHDPMKFAEERRQRLGIKREDYLFENLPGGDPDVRTE